MSWPPPAAAAADGVGKVPADVLLGMCLAAADAEPTELGFPAYALRVYPPYRGRMCPADAAADAEKTSCSADPEETSGYAERTGTAYSPGKAERTASSFSSPAGTWKTHPAVVVVAGVAV